jgi:zinc protease
MISRGLRAAAACLLLAAAPAAATAPDAPKKNANAVEPDPAMLFGTLPNGFRYAVMQNKQPAGSVSVRLLVKAGSYQEGDDELGYAHFIEHMAFRSTRTAPAGILDNPFASMGVALGRDQNAFTTLESTVYAVDVPNANPDGLRKIAEWMRSTVDGIVFSQAAVDVERGVVISELRTRNNPLVAAGEAIARFQLPGLRSVNRSPGGTEASLRAATPARLQAFYDRWYRPENALLVVVGDAPVGDLEALARNAFAGWTARGPAGAQPAAPAALPERGLDATTAVGEAFPPAFSSCRFGPKPPAAANPIEGLRRDTLSTLWTSILERRFSHLSASGQSPMIAGKAMVNRRLLDARATCVILVSTEGKWKEALQAEQTELRRFERDGPTQQELDEAIEALRAPLRGAVTQADARSSPTVAAEIASADFEGRSFAHPAEALRAFNLAVAGVTAGDVRKTFLDDWSGTGPLLAMMGPAAPAKAELLSAWRENEAGAAPAAYADRAAVTWPYASFGRPGRVAQRETLVNFVRLRFRNGTILNFKHTEFKPRDTEVRIRFGRGEAGLVPAERSATEFGVAMFAEGGLGKIDFEQIGAAFASTQWKFSLNVEPTAFVLSGGPMSDQLSGELQLLAAYMTDPAFRPDLDNKLPTALGFVYRYLETDPTSVATNAVDQKIFGGLGALPPRETALRWRAADFARLLKPALLQSPVEVTIVGDISEAEAIDAVARTFGALPARPPLAAAGGGEALRRFPAELPREINAFHQGPAEKAAAMLIWPLYVAVPQRRKEEEALQLLAGIFRERLFQEARVRMGKVYETQVANPMPDYGDEGWLAAQIQASPADLDSVVLVARHIAADLAAGAIRQDEMDRARQLLVAEREPLKNQNAVWAGLISHVRDNPDVFDELLLYSTQMAALTLDDVRAAAATWLKREPMLVRALPQPATGSAAGH